MFQMLGESWAFLALVGRFAPLLVLGMMQVGLCAENWVPGSSSQEVQAEETESCVLRGDHEDPWVLWRPGALPVVPEDQVLGQDPEDPLFEWVEAEDEEPIFNVEAVACSNGLGSPPAHVLRVRARAA